jgi:hypothetical protein
MRSDVELNEEWDLVFSEGDMSIEPSEKQEAKLVIFANRGDYRESPLAGAGFRSSRHAPYTGRIEREVKIQLDNIGLGSLKIEIKNL